MSVWKVKILGSVFENSTLNPSLPRPPLLKHPNQTECKMNARDWQLQPSGTSNQGWHYAARTYIKARAAQSYVISIKPTMHTAVLYFVNRNRDTSAMRLHCCMQKSGKWDATLIAANDPVVQKWVRRGRRRRTKKLDCRFICISCIASTEGCKHGFNATTINSTNITTIDWVLSISVKPKLRCSTAILDGWCDLSSVLSGQIQHAKQTHHKNLADLHVDALRR